MSKPATRARAAKRRAPVTVDAAPKGLRISNALIAEDGQRDHGGYRPRALALPSLPKGVARPATMAMDDAGLGNFPFLNTVGGAAAFGLYWPGYPWLAELAQRSEYRQPTETIAKELTRKWITFKSKGQGDKSKKIEQIQDEFKRFKIQSLFREMATLDGFYGMGMLYVSIDKHRKNEPLVIASEGIEKGSLQGFSRVEPMWVTPLAYNSLDPTLPDFYVPQAWMVMGFETHASRLLIFNSRPVPDIIKPAYNFGGISMTQLIEPYVTRWLKTVDAVNRLINNFSIIVLQTDMAAVLGGADGSELLKRVKFFTQRRDNQGLFLTDKERELLEQLAVPLSGLSELQAQAQEHMAAPTHLPLVVLTGITPAGLNASSESELEVYHDFVHSQQEALFSDNLDKVLKIIQLNLWGEVDEDIVYDYVPLKELVGEAAARVKKMAADAGVAYIQAGVILPEEERERLAHDAESGYVNLDTEKHIEPPGLDDDDDPAANDDDDDEEDEAA